MVKEEHDMLGERTRELGERLGWSDRVPEENAGGAV